MNADDPRLSAYLLGEAEDEDRRAVEEALRADPALAADLEALRSASDWLADKLSALRSPGLTGEQRALLAQMEDRPERAPHPAMGWLWTAVRCGTLAAVLSLPMCLVLPPARVNRAVTPEQRPESPLAPAAAPTPATSRMKITGAHGESHHSIWDTNLDSVPDFTSSTSVDMETRRPIGTNPTDLWISNYPLQLGLGPNIMPVQDITPVQEVPRGFVFHNWSLADRLPDAAHGSSGWLPVEVPDLGLQATKDHPLSTFAINVDTASYSKVRRYLEEGQRPPRHEVRIEELINYFPYDYPEPDAGEPLTVSAEVSRCPWTSGHRLVRVALKGRSVAPAQRPASNLVFLVDVSGSMSGPDRLPLVQQALRLLVEQLREDDRVAIVTYAGAEGLALGTTPGDRRVEILQSIDGLGAGGSTNGSSGISLAYRLALQGFIRGGSNRVILATDGDFNVGVTSPAALEELIREKARSGVFLTVLGFGMGNHQDATLERLADKGNGNHAYIDSLGEARKVFVEQAGGTLFTVARDVKVQIAFDAARVKGWRQIGYENRALAARDFDDDTKDAGELGAGHTVTALYEIDPVKGAPDGELLRVRVRFQNPEGSASRLLEFPLVDRGGTFESATAELRWAAAVAEFGMVVRGSAHRGDATLESAARIGEGALGADPGGHRRAFLELVRRARSVMR